MVNVSRARTRVQELLVYFTKEYLKAYKTALVLSIRDKKNGAAASIDRPDFLLLLSPDAMPQPAVRIEGDVYVGEGMKTKQHWVMGRNYVVAATDVKKGKDEPASPASPSSSASSPSSPMSPSSPSAGGVAPSSPMAGGGRRDSTVPDQADARIWLDNEHTDTCMNPACDTKFGLFTRKRHCRLCGEIFCGKCRDFRLKDESKFAKFCEPCYKLRTNKDTPESKMELLMKPEVRTRLINFNKYKVSLSDADLFAAAGASNAAAKADTKDGNGGKFVLVLTHRRATRPQMKVGFDTEEARDQWRSLMQTASWASPSPITMDPVLRTSFLQAFRKLRWHAWVWSGWDIDGTEGELLSDILSEVLYRELLAAELSSLPDIARKMALKTINGVIVGAVSAAWTGIMKQLGEVRPKVEEVAESLLAPIFDEEQKVKAKIQPPMEEAANKGLEAAEAKLQEVFADKCPVIAAAAEAQLNMITKALHEFVVDQEAKNGSAADFESAWWWVKWRADWTWSSDFQGPISRMIDAKLCEGDAPAPSRQLGNNLIRDLKDLNQSAFTEIRNVMNQSGAAGASTAAELCAALRAAYPDVITRASKDIPMLFQWRMSEALDAAIMPPLMEVTGKVISTVSEPLVALIPEIVRDIVDPERMCSEIISDVATKAEKALCTRILEPLKEATERQGATLAATTL